jgi:hypothetical protein
LAFEGIAIFGDIIDVVLLYAIVIRVFRFLDVAKWLKLEVYQPLAVEVALEKAGDVGPDCLLCW